MNKNKKIIVSAGYMGSGSSAVTNILSEYKNVNTKNAEFEYVFLHMPGGVFDLEDKLLLNNNALRSDEALKTFYYDMNDIYSLRGWWPANYKHYVSPKFINIVEKYIDKLTGDNFRGVWYYHERYKGYKLYKRALINRVRRLLGKPDKVDRFNIAYSLVTKDEFYKYTSEFINDFIELIDTENEDNIVLDQLLLPHNTYRLANYNKHLDIKTIIVERDPRDVFIMNKYIWEPIEQPVLYPFEVEKFCKYYKKLREAEDKSYDNVLRVRFEDLVFNYEESIEKIEDYLSLDNNNHIHKRKYFNPDISIRNIQIYQKEEYKDEVAIIERELKDYLYITDRKVESNDNPF